MKLPDICPLCKGSLRFWQTLNALQNYTTNHKGCDFCGLHWDGEKMFEVVKPSQEAR